MAHKLKRCFAKEWLIILGLSILTLPIAGVLYGIKSHNEHSFEQSINKYQERAKVEWKKRKESHLKLFNQPDKDNTKNKIQLFLEAEARGILSEDQQNLLNETLLELTNEEIINLDIDNSEAPFLPKEKEIDFSKMSTVNLFHVIRSTYKSISILDNAPNQKYFDIVILCFLFVIPVWIATGFIRITIWCIKVVRTKNLD